MKYQELVNVYSALEETTKRLEKTEIIVDFIKDLDEETLEQVGLLILGTIFPAWSDEEIGIGTKLVTKAVADATGTTVDKVEDAVREEAIRSNSFYVTERWLGGTLTNFRTIRKRVKRLEQIEKMEQDGTFDVLPKKRSNNT